MISRSYGLSSIVLLGLFCLGWPQPATASSIQVSAEAARPGSGTGCGGSGCGARLTLEGCMSADEVAVPDQDVGSSQTFEACRTLTAADVDVTSGSTTFRAGESIVLGSGFSVASGASFQAVIDPAATGDGWVEDATPAAESRYVARFYVNLDSMSLPASEQLDHLTGYDAMGRLQFRVGLKHNDAMGENRLFVEVRRDDGSFLSTEDTNELAVPTGWHAIEVDWSAASSAGANDGAVVLCLDDDGSRLSCVQIASGVDNDQARVDFVRWGAQDVDATTGGSFDLDDFDSRRTGPIGL